jgi:inosine-uridine nucleoside N-ribohydrolase
MQYTTRHSYYNIHTMEDISLMPIVDVAACMLALKQKPIDEKQMKTKVDRLQAITSYSEH